MAIVSINIFVVQFLSRYQPHEEHKMEIQYNLNVTDRWITQVAFSQWRLIESKTCAFMYMGTTKCIIDSVLQVSRWWPTQRQKVALESWGSNKAFMLPRRNRPLDSRLLFQRLSNLSKRRSRIIARVHLLHWNGLIYLGVRWVLVISCRGGVS